MKKEITTAFLTLATALGFAQATPEQVHPLESKPVLPAIEEKASLNSSFGYLRIGVSDSQLPKDTQDMLPGLGLGYRIVSGASAYDISASFSRRDISANEVSEVSYSYTLPKANYMYYVFSTKTTSVYAGAGLAFGGNKTSETQEFHGLIPNVTLGYEMGRNSTVRSFVQLDVSQPAVATYQVGELPKAFAELTLGAGF